MYINTHIQKYKDDFLKQQQITYRRTYVSEAENDRLYRKYNLSEADKNEVGKDFRVETDMAGKIRFYTEESETVTDEELSQYALLKSLDKLDNLDIKINIMKNIMIFWCVLTIISIIFFLYLVFN